MRTIDCREISEAVAKMSIQGCYQLPADVYETLESAKTTEESPLGLGILQTITDNADLAKQGVFPMCQDTGLAMIFVELGQDVHIVGGSLTQAINNGVAKGYIDGYLRKSVVEEPVFERKNTKDNTPGFITYDIVPGDKLKITLLPKGIGSENMSALKMCTPSEGREGILDFVVQTITKAGSNPCPPVVVGVGIGGSADKVMLAAKKALLRPLGLKNSDARYAKLEEDLLAKINATGVGPQGLGGRTTALAVNVEYLPTHIGGMPVGVILNCHASRRVSIEL